MGVTESPFLLLQRAAELIERQSEHFADYVESKNHPGETGSPVTWWVYDTVDRMAPTRAKRWVETMNPSVAAPLVAWLRKAADDYKSRERLPKLGDPNPYGAPIDLTGSGLFGPSYWETALEFARLVLGVSAEGMERSDPPAP